MRVAVFGNWRRSGSGLGPEPKSEWKFIGSGKDFTAAGTEIGRALAERGHTLIVESARPDVIDVPVVESYVQHACVSGSPALRVELFHPRGEKRPFEKLAAHNPKLFRYDALPIADPFQSRWTNSHLVSLKHADAVLTIGGRRGTYQAGYAAIVANKPLVPIASFGGSSVDLLRDLKSHYPDLPPAFDSLLGPWNPVTLRSAMDALEGGSGRRMLFISHAHADEAIAAALIDLLTTVFELPTTSIRCTSLAPYRLEVGTHTAGKLKEEIRGAELVLGIVTPNSIWSQYVLFEMGAAWGLGRRTYPLLASGMRRTDVPDPLRELNALDLTSTTDCHQLIDDLVASGRMRRESATSAEVAQRVKRLVATAQSE